VDPHDDTPATPGLGSKGHGAMTDDTIYGLGAIESPPDDRDWDIAQLYAMAGIDPDAAPPPTYVVPTPWPPVLNQGASPMCVAYSSSTLKAWEDLRDTGSADFDEPAFFRAIGGTDAGAVVRDALARLLSVGYPVVTLGQPERHRIAAYYAVPVTREAICAAIAAFGPVLLSTRWPRSWFHPVSGVLPAPTEIIGGHAIVAIGWDARGLRLRNSWGASWGLSGDAWIPWAYLGQVREAWKAVDAIVTPPRPRTWRLHLAPGATVKVAIVTRDHPPKIANWKPDQHWGPRASSAPCSALRVLRGTNSGQAPVIYVPKGAPMVAGHWVRVGRGVTVTSS
jgi:hypothetical protein